MPDPVEPDSFSRTHPWIALAFDFGRRRIGLATADSLTKAARAVGTIQSTVSGTNWPEIERQLREIQPSRLVVGIPVNVDGTPAALTRDAQSFARELQRRFKIPVAAVDERWSSLEASERLRTQRQTGVRRNRVRPEDVDAAAACIILERWLNQI